MPEPDWPLDGTDDMRAIIAGLLTVETRFALVTINSAEGGPRPVGSQMVVVGHDTYAMAIAAAGLQQGWEVTLVRPDGPITPPPLALRYETGRADVSIASLSPDLWTAIAIATHEDSEDEVALAAALRSGAGYVGALGSRKRLDTRRTRMLGRGLSRSDLKRLHAPIGLPIGARTPREIAVAAVAEIIASRRTCIPPTTVVAGVLQVATSDAAAH